MWLEPGRHGREVIHRLATQIPRMSDEVEHAAPMDFVGVPQIDLQGAIGGIERGDLAAVRGEIFLAGVRAARVVHEPGQDFEGFVVALWTDLARSFDWDGA